MKRGARNFAFLSRSGTDSEQAALCVRDLEARGARVQVFRGDAAIKEDVERAVTSIPSNKPLKGIVNAAMVLRVSCDHFTCSSIKLTLIVGRVVPEHDL